MQNYVESARKITTDYFTAARHADQLAQDAANERNAGHITDAYAAELTRTADSERRELYHRASAELDALLRKFAIAASAADMPNGNALQGGDYKLLAENFPMSVEEYKTLCERNKNNPTILRKAVEYGNQHGGIAPYAKKYYRSAEDRIKLFKEFIRKCDAVLSAEPTNPARGDAYWNMIARDVLPWATL